MPTTSGMKPGGFYDRHSSGQRSSIEMLLPWIDRAAQSLPLPPANRPITIVDYGCSEGRNATLVIERAAETLRSRGAAQPICPVYSDLHTNNFGQVLRNLEQAGQLASQHVNFFPLLAGGSFYGPLLPPGTVHLGATFNSVCWLDALPAEPIPDFIIYPGPKPYRKDISVSPAAVAAFTRQAETDLVRFLECRASELVPGGRLLLAVPGRKEEHSTVEGIYDVIHDSCQDLIRDGRLDRTVYQQTLMPVYFRTEEELLHPMAGGGPLCDRFDVELSESRYVPTSFVVNYEQTRDLAVYVEEYVGFVQAFCEPVLRPALAPTQGAETVTAIFDHAKELLRANPDKYYFPCIQVAALLVRK